MKRYVETIREHGGLKEGLPLLKRIEPVDKAYIGYGLLIVSVVVVSYTLGALNLLPHDPDEMDLGMLLAPPGSPGHFLGTDYMGRDIFTRLVLGIKAYFLPGLLAIAVSLCLGTLSGALSGYRRGAAEPVVTYIMNLIDSFPRLVLILLVAAVFSLNIYYIMLVVGITNVPTVAMLIKNKIELLRQKNFIEAATALGLGRTAILLKHILWYNCRSVLIIQATAGMAEAIMMETSLSYLGFGVQEPAPSWGNMVQSGANYFMQGKFWPSTAPALAILFTILGFHLLGDGLNNVLERKRQR